VRVSRELLQLRSGRIREPKVRGTSFVGSRYRATAREDSEVFMCAVVNSDLWGALTQ
jgi:hypothetical protein